MAANEGTSGVRMAKVPEARDGQRLDNFLLLQLKGAPRSLVYKLVRSGQVRINGGRAKADRKLLDIIGKQAQRLNGMAAESVEAAVKNSEPGPSDGSTSV